VKNSMKVVVAYQLWQLVSGRSRDFIPALPQLRLYELKAEGFVDIFFRRGSDKFLAAIQSVKPELQALVMSEGCKLFYMFH